MKTKLLNIAICAFLSSLLLGCKEKETTIINTQDAAIENDSVAGNDTNRGDSYSIESDGTENNSGSAVSAGTSNYQSTSSDSEPSRSGQVSSQSTQSSANKTAKKKSGKDLTGYSAPDGTNAENYDGDVYTKHDTTRMPSGATPIK